MESALLLLLGGAVGIVIGCFVIALVLVSINGGE